MNLYFNVLFCFSVCLLGAYSQTQTRNSGLPKIDKAHIQQLSRTLTECEKNDDLESLLAYYDETAISMPEYQPILQGITEIRAFYKEIFGRQHIKAFQRTTQEIIVLDSTVIEIGTFTKEYTAQHADTNLTQHGKYWNIWKVQRDGSFKLKGEASGFFHPVDNPEDLVVSLNKSQAEVSDISLDKNIPFELKAYNALMEKGVRNRDGILRSEFFYQ